MQIWEYFIVSVEKEYNHSIIFERSTKELEKVLESSSMAKGDGWKVMAKGDGWK